MSLLFAVKAAAALVAVSAPAVPAHSGVAAAALAAPAVVPVDVAAPVAGSQKPVAAAIAAMLKAAIGACGLRVER